MENDAVLYREREGGYKLARVVKVDNAVDPPGYVDRKSTRLNSSHT